MFADQELKDKIAIITGGSRGIGKATSLMLAEQGADVTFFYHSSSEQAMAIVAAAKTKGLKIDAMQVDVRNSDACNATIEEIIDAKGQIDILVNNSGTIRDNLLMGMSDEDIAVVFDTNIKGTFNMTRAVTPFMMRKRRGKIINLSSVAGERPGRGQANYAASKGAINAFTKAMACELAPRNITVNAVAPGVIETDMSKTVRELAEDESKAKILLKRFGQAEDIAHMITFLASKYSDYITGQIFNVDGGFKLA